MNLGPIVVAGFVLVVTQAQDTLVCPCCSLHLSSLLRSICPYCLSICYASVVQRAASDILIPFFASKCHFRWLPAVQPAYGHENSPGASRMTCCLLFLATIIRVGRFTMQLAFAFLLACLCLTCKQAHLSKRGYHPQEPSFETSAIRLSIVSECVSE